MAPGGKSIEDILKALQGTGAIPQTSNPTQSAPVSQYSMPPGMNAYAQPAAAPPAYPQPYAMPAAGPGPAGAVDLSAIKPVSSGTVSIEAAIERAKAIAAQNGVAAYEAAAAASAHPHSYGRSRSRSPRRDQYRDTSSTYNAYRDERRDMAREYGGARERRDRSFSPGARGRNSAGNPYSSRGSNTGAAGNARERSPLGGEDGSETIQVEASLVGLIIGRQGENLRRVESETGCRVQFLTPPGDPTAFRQCKITGPHSRRPEAKISINRIIEDSGMGAIARAGLEKSGAQDFRATSLGRGPSGHGGPGSVGSAGGGGPPSLRENEESMQIMVPDRTVGLIIGRGGETIRDLQERSGCHINIVGESKSINGLRPVNLIGPTDATTKAKDLIMEIVESDTRNAANGGKAAAGGDRGSQHGGGGHKQHHHGYHNDGGGAGGYKGGDVDGGKTNDSIYVPSEAVGMIIGKGGETIREMQNTTGCKINVSPSSGPGEVEREIGLVGSRDSIAKAKQAIEDKVETVNSLQQMQRMKGGPPGGDRGGGGGRGGRHQHHHRQDDSFDNKPRNDYGSLHQHHTDHSNLQQQQQQQQQPPAASAPAPGAADPYAQYGGYQNYVALWYQALAAGAAQSADPSKPAGT